MASASICFMAANDGTDPPPGPWHVLLLVNGTGGGAVHFYQLSTEHMAGPKAVLLQGARHVHVHAWKSESALYEPRTGGPGDTQSLAWLVDSADVTVFGHSGSGFSLLAPSRATIS